MKKYCEVIAWLYFIMLSCPVVAEQEDFFEIIAVNPLEENNEECVAEDGVCNPFRINGDIGYILQYAVRDQQANYNFFRRSSGVSSSRTDMKLQLDYTVSKDLRLRLSVKADYDAKAQDDDFESFFDQSYVDWGDAEGLRLKLGRQLFVLGESDYFQILDIVNPLDVREPGLAELDELRLPVFATRLSYVGNRWGMDLIMPQEFRTVRYPESRGDFDFFIDIGGRENILFPEKPDVDFLSPSWIVRAFISRLWGDASIVAGRAHQNVPSLNEFGNGQFIAGYPVIETLGLSSNFVYQNWLFKGEYAYQRGGLFMRNDIQQQLLSGIMSPVVSQTHPLRQFMLGMRYSGISNTVFNIELLNKNIGDYNELLQDQQQINGSMFSTNHIVWSDKLNLEFQWLRWWEQDSSMISLQLEYVWRDEWLFHIKLIDFTSYDSKGMFEPFKESDRVMLGVNYSF